MVISIMTVCHPLSSFQHDTKAHPIGPHDAFCFVCGSTMELFECQTCENCYHARCMTPSLDLNEVPPFWFCPHCVVNELHIPPPSPEEHFFAPLPSSLPMYPSSMTPASSVLATNTPVITKTGITALDNLKGPPTTWPRKDDQPVGQQLTPPSHEPLNPEKSRPRPQEPSELSKPTGHKKPGRQRYSSPPRKKSKYSAFSKEVDKALSVIYGELETAAGYGKSEGNLESQVQAFEQQLKMQEQQMLLTSRELEFARKELAKEREESAVLKVDNFEIREENMRLKELVDRKENELKEWRAKLRSMIGTELE